MAIFVGNRGNFRLSRSSADVLSATVMPDDVSTSLNRVGIDAGINELLTGDQVQVWTADPRGLAFLAAGNWATNAVEQQGTFYVNVNAVGGVRFFSDFTSAVSNNRANEKTLTTFNGNPIEIQLTIRNTQYRSLARVQSYRFSTDREALDITSLSDGFREQYNGLITGSGSIDILFDYKLNFGESNQEVALAIFQIISRLKLGSRFDALLYVREPSAALGETGADAVFYEFSAVVTQAGIDAAADRIVQATINFVTTGEFFLKVGEANSYVLKEDDDRLILEADLGYLLQEITD